MKRRYQNVKNIILSLFKLRMSEVPTGGNHIKQRRRYFFQKLEVYFEIMGMLSYHQYTAISN